MPKNTPHHPHHDGDDEYDKHSQVRGVRRASQAARAKRNHPRKVIRQHRRNLVVRAEPRQQPDLERIARALVRIAQRDLTTEGNKTITEALQQRGRDD